MPYNERDKHVWRKSQLSLFFSPNLKGSGMDEIENIRLEVGKVVADCGRMLMRQRAFTQKDLTDLAEALSASAETIRIIRDKIFK